MNFKLPIALTLAVSSFPTIAGPTMLTELESGDAWLQAYFATDDTDIDVTAQSGGAKGKTNISTDDFGVAFITGLDEFGGITPLLGASVLSAKSEGEDVTEFDLSVGALFKTQDQRTIAAQGVYNGSSDKKEVRESFTASLDVQTSQVESSIYNKFTISALLMSTNEGTSGGHNVSISNDTRFPLNPTLDIVTTAGMAIISDVETPNDRVLSYDPTFIFGVQLNVHLAPSMTIEIAANKVFSDGVDDRAGQKFDFSYNATQVGVSLITRF
jgi:hypothetical protein